jgi:hypothetical protein
VAAETPLVSSNELGSGLAVTSEVSVASGVSVVVVAVGLAVAVSGTSLYWSWVADVVDVAVDVAVGLGRALGLVVSSQPSSEQSGEFTHVQPFRVSRVESITGLGTYHQAIV